MKNVIQVKHKSRIKANRTGSGVEDVSSISGTQENKNPELDLTLSI